MKTKYLQVRTDSLLNAYKVAKQIHEFDQLYSIEEFENRLKSKKHLILIAYYKNKPIGFKIGYETLSKKHFYSWMGGVLKNYRKFGAAQLLLDSQEKWATDSSYDRILVKTRKKHTSMIIFLEKNNYIELGILPHQPDQESRILFEKEL